MEDLGVTRVRGDGWRGVRRKSAEAATKGNLGEFRCIPTQSMGTRENAGMLALTQHASGRGHHGITQLRSEGEAVEPVHANALGVAKG